MGNGLAQQTAMRYIEHDTGPLHHSVMRSNAFARAWGEASLGPTAPCDGPPMLPLSLVLASACFSSISPCHWESSSAFLMWPWWPWPLAPSGGARPLASLSLHGLTFLGFVGSPPGTPAWFDITNRALALGTLWVTMFLVRRFQGGAPTLRQPHTNGYASLWR